MRYEAVIYDAGFGVFLDHPPKASVLLSASVERCFVSRMRDFFCPICIPKVLEFTKTKVLRQSGPGEINGRYDYGHRSIICKKKFHLSPPLPLLLNYPNIVCIKTNLEKICTTFIKKLHNKWILRDPFLPWLFYNHLSHSISNTVFCCFSYIIAMVPKKSPTVAI